MCGRYSITGDLDFYAEYFGVEDVDVAAHQPSWNVAPTDPVLVIRQRSDQSRVIDQVGWGLIPHWAPDTRKRHINARSETVATAPAFRDSFSRRRCLIPADGFYEWEPPEQGRTPHWIRRADGYPLAFAGIWASWRDPDTGQWLRNCSIVTGAAGPTLEGIHDRMPMTIHEDGWSAWLDRTMIDREAALRLLVDAPQPELMEHVVSSRVNSVRNNDSQLVEPVPPETLF